MTYWITQKRMYVGTYGQEEGRKQSVCLGEAVRRSYESTQGEPKIAAGCVDGGDGNGGSSSRDGGIVGLGVWMHVGSMLEARSGRSCRYRMPNTPTLHSLSVRWIKSSS